MKNDIQDINRYDDIINLSRHVSISHPPMPIIDRAAQFSPFAAVTGFDGAIKETARLTDERIVLDESAKSVLDEKLRIVQEQLDKRPEITITYFQQDKKKAGGAYISTSGRVRKIDNYERTINMQDGTIIEIEDIIIITGEIFKPIDDFYE